MKSRFAGIREADLISSEAARRRFHPSLLGFHRAKHDFIKSTRLARDLARERRNLLRHFADAKNRKVNPPPVNS
jgi:hypothetical protein